MVYNANEPLHGSTDQKLTCCNEIVTPIFQTKYNQSVRHFVTDTNSCNQAI